MLQSIRNTGFTRTQLGHHSYGHAVSRTLVREALRWFLQPSSSHGAGPWWTVARRWRNHAAMIGPAKIYFIIFGLLTIAGGVMGYVKAGSTASIIAGSISGVLLLLAAFLLPQQFAVALILAALVSIALAGRFLPAFLKTGKMMPAGMMAILSVIGIVMAILAWIKK